MKKENGATRLCWCAIERSSEPGAARRESRNTSYVAAKVHGSLGYLEVDENASVLSKMEEVIKFGGAPQMLRKARFWTMLATEHNLDWDKTKGR